MRVAISLVRVMSIIWFTAGRNSMAATVVGDACAGLDAMSPDFLLQLQ